MFPDIRLLPSAIRGTLDEWSRTRWEDLRFTDARDAILLCAALLAIVLLVLLIRAVQGRRPGGTHIALPALLPLMRISHLSAARHLPVLLFCTGVPLFAITNFAGPKWAESVARFPFLGASFRDVVVSGHEGVVKPDPEIFRRCLDRNGLSAAACVFVDDSAANVAGAAAVGLDAIRFTSVEALRPELAERGLL